MGGFAESGLTLAVFEPTGSDRFVPSGLARGPWDENAMHGGAPASLLVHVIEQIPTPTPFASARMTFEYLRPVPLAPLTVTTRLVRSGRRIQFVEAVLTEDDIEFVRAQVVRVRREQMELPPDSDQIDDPLPPAPESAQPLSTSFHADRQTFADAFDMRFVVSSLFEIGPGKVWFRPLTPFVAGAPNSPAMRAVAAADFGNGVSAPLPFDSYRFVNADLNVNVYRDATSDWIGIDSRSAPQASGIGMTETRLFDLGGRMGLASQTLFVEAI